jgi:hypothetical protein
MNSAEIRVLLSLYRKIIFFGVGDLHVLVAEIISFTLYVSQCMLLHVIRMIHGYYYQGVASFAGNITNRKEHAPRDHRYTRVHLRNPRKVLHLKR